MYFFVDESGHTGKELFDKNQSTLFYGTLSSPVNLDIHLQGRLSRLRSMFGVNRLHAAELGIGRLNSIADDLIKIQHGFDIRFDFFSVNKPDHAIISFFDQVFDQGLNPAVPWTGYWTPLRYILLIKVAYLFNEDLAKKAWKARLEQNDAIAEKALAELCLEIIERVEELPDPRSKEIIGDALLWAFKNPSNIGYNSKGKLNQKQIMPNLIGFQSVLHGIAKRLSSQGKQAQSIVVDQQSEFNNAQKILMETYIKMKGVPFTTGPDLPSMDLDKIPTLPITVKAGTDSIGLELVDIYLWLFKRAYEKKEISPKLLNLIKPQFEKGFHDEVSIAAIQGRWKPYFENLPEPTEEMYTKGMELKNFDEQRRLKTMEGLR